MKLSFLKPHFEFCFSQLMKTRIASFKNDMFEVTEFPFLPSIKTMVVSLSNILKHVGLSDKLDRCFRLEGIAVNPDLDSDTGIEKKRAP